MPWHFSLCKMSTVSHVNTSNKKKRICLALNVLIALKKVEENKRKEKRFWVNPLLVRRSEINIEEYLLKDLQWGNDAVDFKNFTRITVTEFEEILVMVRIQFWLFLKYF